MALPVIPEFTNQDLADAVRKTDLGFLIQSLQEVSSDIVALEEYLRKVAPMVSAWAPTERFLGRPAEATTDVVAWAAGEPDGRKRICWARLPAPFDSNWLMMPFALLPALERTILVEASAPTRILGSRGLPALVKAVAEAGAALIAGCDDGS